jgi:hypothetical protein
MTISHFASRVLSLFSVMVGIGSMVSAAEIHVKPDGPIHTLAEAQAEARKNPSSTVIVHGGTYYLPQTLVFTPADSGTSYVAASGESPVISGGMKLDLHWQPYKDGILQAKVPAGMTFDQLFVNDKQQTMARYPNYDSTAVIFNGTAADAISPERARRWADPAGGFIHALHKARWGSFDFMITGKDANGNLRYKGGTQSNESGSLHPDYRLVENIFEELDAPGEWYLNNKTSTLYFYPPAGVDLKTAKFEVSRLRTLVTFRGEEMSPVKNITLRGLTFKHALRTFMETKVPMLRSDWTIARAGALFLSGTENCTIDDCAIQQVGGNAIFVNMFNRHVTIKDCLINNIGASGVCFVGDTRAQRSPRFMGPHGSNNYGPCAEDIVAAGGSLKDVEITDIDKTPGPKTSNYPSDSLVDNCLIHDTGRVEKQTSGVTIFLASRITIRHCSIYGSPRAAINIGCGSWGGHVIEFCDVFDAVLETHDHGAFNSWGRDRWFVTGGPDWANEMIVKWPEFPFADSVETNIIRNSRWRCDTGWDIDLDDASTNYRIYNNLCLAGGIKIPDGYRRTVENNIILNSTLIAHKWFNVNSENVFRHNIVFAPYRTGYGYTKGLQGRDVDDNLLYAVGQITAPANALKLISGLDAHSLMGDPMFVDPAKGDFRVKEGSPALKLGFRNFPMDQFGVQYPKLKALAKTPEIPVPGNLSDVRTPQASRDPAVVSWEGAKIKNIVGFEEVTQIGMNQETGVRLMEVPNDSRVAKEGLRKNDVILKRNGKEVKSVADLLRQEARFKDATTLDIWRDNHPISVSLHITNP